jgi:ethanolamine-phosphate cytidylyltransferase
MYNLNLAELSIIVSSAERYHYPKQMGILTQIPSPSDFKLMDITHRIQAKQQEFQAKIERKKKAEREWFDNKYQPASSNGQTNGLKK